MSETPGETEIQQFMMRLSRNLRRFRWLVFASWLLALVPAIYLVLTQSGHLTGGGFEVAGSQSLLVHDQLERNTTTRARPRWRWSQHPARTPATRT